MNINNIIISLSNVRHHACATITVLLIVSGCASNSMLDQNQVTTTVLLDTSTTYLAKQFQPYTDEHPSLTGLYPVESGTKALVTRLALINSAEKSLDVQYYIWHDDMTGKLMQQALLDAADRGVRVRLLLDDMDTAGKDGSLAALDSHANIELRVFNPFSNRNFRLADLFSIPARLNHRMHNKSLTVDNRATIVGGRNIGNEYFSAEAHVDFADLDVIAIGTAVNEVSTAFDLYWNHKYVVNFSYFYPDYDAGKPLEQLRSELDSNHESAKKSAYAEAIAENYDLHQRVLIPENWHWGTATVIYDDPIKIEDKSNPDETHLGAMLHKIVGQTKRELVVISPYFVPGKRFTKYLGTLTEQGIKVKILTNSLAATDVALVHAGYMNYRADLLSANVELYEYKPDTNQVDLSSKMKMSGSSPGSLHAKTLAIDQRWIFIGSFNVDPRSVLWNTEIGIIADSPVLAGTLSSGFENDIRNAAYELTFDPESKKIAWLEYDGDQVSRHEKEPHTSGWQRFVVRIMSWLPIESQL
ncbi:MAG: phospholipase D family protein [Pseudomonadales bacterium]|nr:phospholipase D family protein [Pseudomonadales bacterium]